MRQATAAMSEGMRRLGSRGVSPARAAVLGAAIGAVLSSGACKPAASARAPCAEGELVVHGVCATPEDAAAFCGKAAQWSDGACEPRPCGEGLVRDRVTAECVGHRAVRAMAMAMAEEAHAAMPRLEEEEEEEEDVVDCPPGRELRVAARHVRCVDAGGVPRDRCAPRAAFDASTRACVPFADARGELDPARWVRALYGPDGGAGSPELCARVAIDPAAYGLSAGATSIVSIAIDVIFPDNDVTLVRATAWASAIPAGGGTRPLPAAADALVQRAVTAPLELLRLLGGTSRAGAVTTRVQCAVHGGSPPFGAPRARPLTPNPSATRLAPCLASPCLAPPPP